MSPPTAIGPVGASPPRGGDWFVPSHNCPIPAGLRRAASSLHAWAGAPERSKRRPLRLTTSLRSILLGPSSTAKVIAADCVLFEEQDIEVIRLPPKSPNLNAYA